MTKRANKLAVLTALIAITLVSNGCDWMKTKAIEKNATDTEPTKTEIDTKPMVLTFYNASDSNKLVTVERVTLIATTPTSFVPSYSYAQNSVTIDRPTHDGESYLLLVSLGSLYPIAQFKFSYNPSEGCGAEHVDMMMNGGNSSCGPTSGQGGVDYAVDGTSAVFFHWAPQ